MRRSAILAAAVALLVLGGVAYASIPDANGVIHGCRKNSGGALRVIDSDAGQTCAGSETALNWSQTGPPGLSGLERVQADSGVSIQPGDTATVLAQCPTGKKAIAGGFVNIAWTNIVVSRSQQSGDSTGWTTTFANPSATPGSGGTGYAICAVVA
jgi:hypothetical protein